MISDNPIESTEHQKLARWVERQRELHNKKCLGKAKIAKMESLGFLWNIQGTGERQLVRNLQAKDLTGKSEGSREVIPTEISLQGSTESDISELQNRKSKSKSKYSSEYQEGGYQDWLVPTTHDWPEACKYHEMKDGTQVKLTLRADFRRARLLHTPLQVSCFSHEKINKIRKLAEGLVKECDFNPKENLMDTTVDFSLWEESSTGLHQNMIGSALLTRAVIQGTGRTLRGRSAGIEVNVCILCLFAIIIPKQGSRIGREILPNIEEYLQGKGFDIVVCDGERRDFYEKQHYKQNTSIQCPFPEDRENYFFVKGLTDKGKNLVNEDPNKTQYRVCYESAALKAYYQTAE